MKRTTLIIALAFGMGFLLTNKVNAIHPMQFNPLLASFNAEFNLERDIRLEDWMLSVPSFKGTAGTENDIALSPWMFDVSWTENAVSLAAEPELELEGWMLDAPRSNERTVALEDWMLNTWSL